MAITALHAEEALDLWTWYPHRWATSFLPPGADLLSMRLVSRVSAQLHPAELIRCEQNVKRGLPELPEPLAVARRSLATRYLDSVSAVCLPKLTPETLHHYLDLVGLEHLEASRAAGRGVILAHPCMGPLRLAFSGLGVAGHPVVRLESPEDQQDDARFLLRQAHAVRRRLEAQAPGTVMNGRGYLRPLLRRLQDGELVGLAYDGTPPGIGEQIGRRIELELLGQRVWFPVGPVYLALRSGAALHPMVVLPRRGRTGFEVRIEPALPMEARADIRETLRVNTARLVSLLEAHLRADPGGWHFWCDFEPGRMML